MQIANLTPAMKQYVQMKQENPDCILFFRIGDFYEVFFEDAKICASVLDLVITSKNKNAENPIPMAGIPHHSLDKYIPKLIAKGYKIAVAEQTTDPIPGKIVEREIKIIVTPGTYLQEQNNSLSTILSITSKNQKSGLSYHIAWGDFSLGHYFTKSFDDLGKLQKMILQLRPMEIILDTDIPFKEEFISPIQQYLECLISVYAVPVDPEYFLKKTCKVHHLESFGQAVQGGRGEALALLFGYIQHTQQQELNNVVKISLHSSEGLVLLDEVTIKNLELFSSSYESNKKYSVVGIMDTTKTPGGARLFSELLQHPINKKSELDRRLAQILYYQHYEATKLIHRELGAFFDIPKLVSLIVYQRGGYQVFQKLRTVLGKVFSGSEQILNELIRIGLDSEVVLEMKQLYEGLQALLKPDDELLGEENYIAEGYHLEIDRLRNIAYHSDDALLSYQQELVAKTGITNIKLKYVMNQGYFLELTTKDAQLFEQFLKHQHPEELETSEQEKWDIVRRQTLKSNQRYTSPYLDSLQGDIIEAKMQLKQQEAQVLQEFGEKIQDLVSSLSLFAEKLDRLDVFTSHALFAKQHGFQAPEMLEKNVVEIQGGRHLVIEAFLPNDEPFIPNNLAIGKTSGTQASEYGIIHIITGPNMGGKSTYLRQSALIVLLAHCGFYVPAKQAKIGLVDGIFARVGSGDIIAKNQSTFMTEMIEVANILNNATEKSFIIFDELGRGTSTYDGLALTKAILHYILSEVKAKTLIATHYHELIALEQESKLIKNFSLSVYETEKEVIFTKKITPGGANKSYGIDVAKLAGIPKPILEEAKAFLYDLEKNKKSDASRVGNASVGLFSLPQEQFMQKAHYEKIKTMLAGKDLNAITPLQALQILMKIKEEL